MLGCLSKIYLLSATSPFQTPWSRSHSLFLQLKTECRCAFSEAPVSHSRVSFVYQPRPGSLRLTSISDSYLAVELSEGATVTPWFLPCDPSFTATTDTLCRDVVLYLPLHLCVLYVLLALLETTPVVGFRSVDTQPTRNRSPRSLPFRQPQPVYHLTRLHGRRTSSLPVIARSRPPRHEILRSFPLRCQQPP